MKKLTLILSLLLAFGLAHAQYVNVDFETGGLGADWDWTVGENGDNPPLEIVANPSATGANTSATVAKFTARQAGMSWALCYADDMADFTFDASNNTVTIQVYKTVVSNIGMKFEGTSAAVEVQVANTLVNQWETITFDFSASIGESYSRVIIIPDFEERNEERIVYFDNIQLPEGNTQPIPEPETPAPTPTYSADDVVSLFSNPYTNITVDTWSADWDNANVSDVQIDGDDTKLYTSMVFAGVEFTSQMVDATNLEYFHMDIWTPDATASPVVFMVKLVDFGADGAYGGGDDVEHEIAFDDATLATEAWVSLDIPLADFTGLTTRAHLAQLVLSGDLTTVYVDNVYFRGQGSAPNTPDTAAPTPTYAANEIVSLFSDAYTDVTVDTWSADWDEANVSDVQIDGDNAKLYTSLVYAGVEFTSSTIDATDLEYFHMDVWTPDATASPAVFNVKLVDFGADGQYGGDDDVEHELSFGDDVMDTETWVSLDMALADFTGLTTRAHLAQLVITSDPNTVYIDNVYFRDSDVGVDDEDVPSGALAMLGGNYPNPFNPVTTIRFSLAEQTQVSLRVYDVKGRLVETLLDGHQSAGDHEIVWEADGFASGVYFYALSTGDTVETKRMVLLK